MDRWLVLALTSLASFVVLAVLLGVRAPPTALDRFAAPSSAFADAASIVTTWTAGARDFAALAAMLVLAWRRRWSASVAVLGATLATQALIEPVKWIFRRPRPVDAVTTGWAFPSGHAWAATVEWGSLLLLVPVVLGAPRPWRVGLAAAFACIALVAGLARVAEGDHWLTDVIGGWLVGIAILALAVRASDLPWPWPRRENVDAEAQA